MTVCILAGDVFEQLAGIKSNSIDCVVTSPPYWGLRQYIEDGQPEKKHEIGLEPTLAEHIEVLVRVFREIRRVLKPHGTLWLNYGDCYAAAPNGKSAAAYKADGTDDRTFRDKPFSTVGPIHPPGPGQPFPEGISRRGGGNAPSGPIYSPNYHGDRGVRGKVHRRAAGVSSPSAIVAGGFLKPKDLCMIPNRLAIALQDDGWYVRSEIIWHKPNPMPESVYDRPTTAHEKVWLLTKNEDYYYNHEAIREPVSGGTHPRRAGPNSRQNVDRVPVSRKIGPGKTVAKRNGVKNNSSFNAAMLDVLPTETRNARNVWTIAPKPFREAHFATFPPGLAERCLKAGVPPTVCGCCGAVTGCGPICESFPRVPGRVLDPFGGAGTVGMVAEQLGFDSTLIELNPKSVTIAENRIEAARVAAVGKAA